MPILATPRECRWIFGWCREVIGSGVTARPRPRRSCSRNPLCVSEVSNIHMRSQSSFVLLLSVGLPLLSFCVCHLPYILGFCVCHLPYILFGPLPLSGYDSVLSFRTIASSVKDFTLSASCWGCKARARQRQKQKKGRRRGRHQEQQKNSNAPIKRTLATLHRLSMSRAEEASPACSTGFPIRPSHPSLQELRRDWQMLVNAYILI